VHDADGCAAVLALSDVASHEAACPFELLTCPHGPLYALPLCGAQFRRAEQSAHDRVCALRPRACVHGCAALLPPRAVRDALERGGDDAERAVAALLMHSQARGVCSHSGVVICDMLLAVMADNVEHAGVQREACALLAALTTEAVRPVMVISTVVRAMLAALGAHPQDKSLHVQACLVLRQLARGTTNNESGQFALALAAAGGLQAVLDVMRAHPSSAAVQEAACVAVLQITHSADENKVAAGGAGAIEAVISTLNAHASHPGVQVYACWALANMATNDDNQAKAGCAGAFEAVIAAMNSHGAHAGLQEAACWALANLAANVDNEAKAGSAGAIETAVTAMNAHGANAGVQLYACEALKNICWTRCDLRSRARAAGAVAALDAALARFPTGDVATQAKEAKETVTPE
jgi:hypothetical protein